MKKHLAILSVLVLFAFCGCKKFAGEPITKNFVIEGSYTSLDVENAFEVYVYDTISQITVTAGENVMPKVVVEKVNNTLKIYLKPISISGASELKVFLPYNAGLTNVELSGASEFHSNFALKGEKVEVDLSGASDFYANIEANHADIDLSGSSYFSGNIVADETNMDFSGASSLKGNIATAKLGLDLSGSSDVTLAGYATTLKLDLTGASSIEKKTVGTQYALSCDYCEGSMAGSSDAYIHCNTSIRVNLSGASDLHFTGDASTADSSTTGDSRIIHDVL